MWWLLDRSIVNEIMGLLPKMGVEVRGDAVGLRCVFADRPITPQMPDPTGVRAALASLRAASDDRPDLVPVSVLAERAVLDSSAVYDHLTGFETRQAKTTVEVIASALVLVAPMSGGPSAAERRFGAWRAAQTAHPQLLEPAERLGPQPEAAQWFIARIRDLAGVGEALALIRSADTRSELESDLSRIARALEAYVDAQTWSAGPRS